MFVCVLSSREILGILYGQWSGYLLQFLKVETVVHALITFVRSGAGTRWRYRDGLRNTKD